MSKTYSAEEVAKHTSRDDIWIIYKDKVYDVTQYLDEHPGGEEVILDCAGADSTEAFDDIGHSEDAVEQLASLYIGDLVGGSVKTKTATKSSTDGASQLPLIVAGIVAVAGIAYFALKK